MKIDAFLHATSPLIRFVMSADSAEEGRALRLAVEHAKKHDLHLVANPRYIDAVVSGVMSMTLEWEKAPAPYLREHAIECLIMALNDCVRVLKCWKVEREQAEAGFARPTGDLLPYVDGALHSAAEAVALLKSMAPTVGSQTERDDAAGKYEYKTYRAGTSGHHYERWDRCVDEGRAAFHSGTTLSDAVWPNEGAGSAEGQFFLAGYVSAMAGTVRQEQRTLATVIRDLTAPGLAKIVAAVAATDPEKPTEPTKGA